MALAFSTPPYIYQSPSGYIFRFRVPKDLQQVVSRTEFQYSLRAGALRVAKVRVRAIASFIQQLFEKVRKRMVEYTPKQILELVKNHVGDVIHNGEGIETLQGIAIDGTPVMTPSYLEQSNGAGLLSPERIKEITLDYIRETLANDEKARATMGTSGDALSPLEASTKTSDEAKAIIQYRLTSWIR